jgi:hypothetical protein
MPHAAAELAAELVALAEASRAALTRLRAGDESELVSLLDARERLVQALEAATVAYADPALVEAARQAIAMDAEIMAALEEQRNTVARQLERLVSQRHSLASYGGRRDGGGMYVERLG